MLNIWKQVRHDVLMKNNTWVPHEWIYSGKRKPTIKTYNGKRLPTASELHSFTYTKRNGEVQKCLALICVEEREWRLNFFAWLPWPKKIQRNIDVLFDVEIGEKTGFWDEGGTGSTSVILMPNETPLQALRRLEADWNANGHY